MTRIAKMGKVTEEKASVFQAVDLKAKKRRHRDSKVKTAGEKDNEQQSKTMKRRMRKKKGMECFHCRRTGHSVQDCPESKQSVLCYKCGQEDHSLNQCLLKTNKLPFATCFICKQMGHLVGQCPENELGVYPHGGSCKFCGSVRHLARNCRPLENNLTIGKMTMDQGGDDDDQYYALQKICDAEPMAKAILATRTASCKPKVVVF